MGKRQNVKKSECVTAEQVLDLMKIIEDRHDNKLTLNSANFKDFLRGSQIS